MVLVELGPSCTGGAIWEKDAEEKPRPYSTTSVDQRNVRECCYKANAGASPFAYGWDKCFASYAECILFSNTVFSD
jgi:hypothetical protein